MVGQCQHLPSCMMSVFLCQCFCDSLGLSFMVISQLPHSQTSSSRQKKGRKSSTNYISPLPRRLLFTSYLLELGHMATLKEGQGRQRKQRRRLSQLASRTRHLTRESYLHKAEHIATLNKIGVLLENKEEFQGDWESNQKDLPNISTSSPQTIGYSLVIPRTAIHSI